MMTSMAGSETTVMDRQLAMFKWQHETASAYLSNHIIPNYVENHRNGSQNQEDGNEVITCQSNVWPDLAIGRYPVVREVVSGGGVSSESSPSSVKRKSVDSGTNKVGAGSKEENMRAVKKAKRDEVVEAEEESPQISKEGSEGKNGSGASQKKSKAAAAERTDYIHVRARRGQATDSHSLAERVRREKISERMKYLQDLVPGCNKITGKAGMLDEIINYVQSLQKQVEFLSMRLAAAHPRVDFSVDQLFSKEINQACSDNIPRVGMPSEVADPSYLQFNPMGDVVASCGFDTTMQQSGLPHRRNAAIMSASDAAVDPSLNVHGSSLGWENDIQNVYNLEFHQGRGLSLPFQFLQGLMMSNTAKMEL